MAAQDQVAEAFFRELSIALGRKDTAKEAKRTVAKFSAYAAYLKIGCFAISSLRSLLAKILWVAGLFGMAGFKFGAPWTKPLFGYGGFIALVAAGILEKSTSQTEILDSCRDR